MKDIDHEHSDLAKNRTRRGARVAGTVILIASVLVVFAMLHHPTASSHHFEELVDEIEAIGTINALVHGSAIMIMGLFVFGFSWLSTCLGLDRSSVRVALIAYSLGAMAMICAAMVSGFIVPLFMERYQDASQSEISGAMHSLGLLREVNRAFDQLGVIAMSVGVFFWSVAMLGQTNRFWITGILGLLVGLLGIAGIFTGLFAATVQGIILFVVFQSIWNIVVGVQMIRGRF